MVATELPASVSVGPNAVIGVGCRIGEGAVIGAGCLIGDAVSIGAGSLFYAGVKVYDGCTIGARAILHSGAVIGADGLGFARDARPVVDRLGDDLRRTELTRSTDRGLDADKETRMRFRIGNLRDWLAQDARQGQTGFGKGGADAVPILVRPVPELDRLKAGGVRRANAIGKARGFGNHLAGARRTRQGRQTAGVGEQPFDAGRKAGQTTTSCATRPALPKMRR